MPKAPAPPPLVHLVSRHPGALEWLRKAAGARPIQEHTHLSEGFRAHPGEEVWGVLPLHWVLRLNQQGVQTWVLECEVPAHLRGQELSASQLTELRTRLAAYRIEALGHRCPGVHTEDHNVTD